MTNPTIPQALSLIRALYAESAPCTRGTGCVGGHLHVVLDDCNLEPHFIESALEHAQADKCGPCTEIAQLLLRMSAAQLDEVCDSEYSAW